MMISLFKFEHTYIRVIFDECDIPWFIGRDVAEALRYRYSFAAVKLHCKGVQKLYPFINANGSVQEVRLIDTSDMLRLVAESKFSEVAKHFGNWVFETILQKEAPTISENTLDTRQLGKHLGIPAHQTNLLLKDMALQFKDENNCWAPTETGKRYSETKEFQIRWKPSVIKTARTFLGQCT